MSARRAIAGTALCFVIAGVVQPAGQRPAVAPRSVLESIASALGVEDVTTAKAAADAALASYPEDPVLRNLAGVVEARRGASQAAQAHFEAAIRGQPRAPAAYLNLGRLLQERAPSEPSARSHALAVYARLLTVDPLHQEALFQTARLTALEGEYARARAFLDRLPAAARARAQAMALHAVVLAGTGEAGAAEAAVATLGAHPQLAREDVEAVLPAVSRLPDDTVERALLALLDRRGWSTAQTLRRLGAIDARRHRHADARRWLEQAAALGGVDASLLVELARVAFKGSDPKGALGYLAHARALAPGDPAVHFLYGIVCVELDLGAEAHDALSRAVALRPDDPDINYAMGSVSLHRHDPSEALPFFEAYVRLRPDDPRGRFALGAARYYSQQLDAARLDLTAALGDPATAGGAHYYLARIARQQHQLATARREIEAALRINPSHADAWAELGLIETRDQRYAAAEAALQKALSFDADHYEATLHLAALYGRMRDPRRSAQEARLRTLVARREARAQDFLRLVEAVP